MNLKIILSGLLVLVVAAVVLVACQVTPESGPDFDRRKMLENVADNLIKPAFSDLQTQTDGLKTATDVFVQNPDNQNLIKLQSAWKSACTAWQAANAYNFGPAGEQGLRKGLVEEIGTFPASVSKIEASVAGGNPNFNDFNRDARGFMAVEYLVFDLEGDNARIMASFADANRKRFLSGAVANIQTRVSEVVAAWKGGYRAEFVADDGTDAGSSTAQFYNEFVRSFEAVKNFKVGLPLGKRPGQTQPEPARAEAYYSGQSLPMIQNHLAALEKIWYGKGREGQDGSGFKEYLEAVEGGREVATATEKQLAAIKTALAALPATTPFSQQIQTQPAPVEAFYNELQKNVRYFKSDMSSRLGIAITFSSGDGD